MPRPLSFALIATLAFACNLFLGVVAFAESPMDKRVTFSADKITTGQALERLSRETGIRIDLKVGDLQKQGITKNQSFGIELKDATVRQALSKILHKGDPEGRLVYFVKEDGTIVVTTVYEVEMASKVSVSRLTYG